MYNLLKRQAEVEILPLCAAERLACFPYSPVAGGLLSGKYGVTRRPDHGRILDVGMYARRYAAPGNYEIADRFAALAADLRVAPAALAIAWVGAHPAVTAPLIGARTLDQIEVALGSLRIEVSPELRARIGALAPTPAPANDRSDERVAAS
jgi:aryl-alcohol dehydrogenase-like predicted oxidoreductase